jgi:hypothetical protein
MSAGCLKELKSLQFPDELRDVVTVCQAAKARVLRFEAGGKLNVRGRARELRAAADCCDFGTVARYGWLRSWLGNSFLLHLEKADDEVVKKPVVCK